jgi:hypothetical protein
MEKFLLLFVGLGAPTEVAPSDAVTQAYVGQWGAYMGALAADGRLESGSPLQVGGSSVTKHGATPLIPETVDIGGFVLITADSLADAEKVAGQAPHIALGGTTLVRPLLAF